MRIAILTEGPFPFGMAATTRLVAYASGMVDSASEVYVICSKPTEPANKLTPNTNISGTFQGIKYVYTAGKTIRSTGALARSQDYFLGFFRARKELSRLHKEAALDVLFMGLSNFWFTWHFYRFTRKHGILFMQERSEYPFIGVAGLKQRFNLWFYLRVTLNFFDSIIVITRALEIYFKKWLRKDASVFLLPMMVESERFVNTRKPPQSPERYIAYVGTMHGMKDGVPILVEAFGQIATDYPDLQLVLIGDTSFEGYQLLQDKIEDLGLTERIVFPGQIQRDDLPAWLKEATLLALARPTSKQAEGGFPNKLGEYLATGNPVVVTAVGEIPEFLTDGVNAFISIPDDSVAFADKLKEALDQPEAAKKIGERGKELTETTFHPRFQAERMLAFFKQLQN